MFRRMRTKKKYTCIDPNHFFIAAWILAFGGLNLFPSAQRATAIPGQEGAIGILVELWEHLVTWGLE